MYLHVRRNIVSSFDWCFCSYVCTFYRISKNEEDLHKDDDNMDLGDIQSADKVTAVSIDVQKVLLLPVTVPFVIDLRILLVPGASFSCVINTVYSAH